VKATPMSNRDYQAFAEGETRLFIEHEEVVELRDIEINMDADVFSVKFRSKFVPGHVGQQNLFNRNTSALFIEVRFPCDIGSYCFLGKVRTLRVSLHKNSEKTIDGVLDDSTQKSQVRFI
jgi:hypothetical protein